jgi:hypothetical protein
MTGEIMRAAVLAYEFASNEPPSPRAPGAAAHAGPGTGSAARTR